MLRNQSKVLLPEWLLEKKSTLPEREYMTLVKRYLTKYPDYELVRFEDSFAVCNRPQIVEKKRKGRGKT